MIVRPIQQDVSLLDAHLVLGVLAVRPVGHNDPSNLMKNDPNFKKSHPLVTEAHCNDRNRLNSLFCLFYDCGMAWMMCMMTNLSLVTAFFQRIV